MTEQKTLLGLNDKDELILSKTSNDKYGYEHRKYQQYYKGLLVKGGEITEHIKGGKVEFMNGKVVENLQFESNPTISESKALSICLEKIGAKKYTWEDIRWEESVKEETENNEASNFPKGKLEFCLVTGSELISKNYDMVWTFQIHTLEPASIKNAIISATNGDIISIKEEGEHNGPAVTLFSGTQQIDSKWVGGFNYNFILRADDNGRKIHTKQGSSANNFYWTSNVTNSNDNWGATQSILTSPHWAASQSWDFFSNTYGQNGMNGNGGEVRIWANSNLPNNAVYQSVGSNDYIEFGSFNGLNLATVDIVGHEFTHGVTKHISGLGGTREPGALNESFSDIFGVMIERAATGQLDWNIAEDIGAPFVRSLQNPISNIYLNGGWVPATPAACPTPNAANDDCGVHTNLGPQNRWFNLLSVGGVQAVNLGNGLLQNVFVQPIGIDNAAQITYHNLYNNMQNESQYIDAREGAISSARIIFGSCSPQLIQTTNAWAAVGVGNRFFSVLSAPGVKKICTQAATKFNITASDCPGATFTWTGIPSSWSVIQSFGSGSSTLIVNNIGNTPSPSDVIITVTSSLGSSQTIIVQVRIDECGYQPKIAIINNNANSSSKTQTLSNDDGSIIAFPNPTSGLTQIFIPEAFLNTTLTITNTTGQILKEVLINDSWLNVDLSTFSNGLYIGRIVDSNRNSKSFKLIKN